eukprot:365372-Chlamydomonas_euryale.AAC.4
MRSTISPRRVLRPKSGAASRHQQDSSSRPPPFSRKSFPLPPTQTIAARPHQFTLNLVARLSVVVEAARPVARPNVQPAAP